MSKVLCIYHGPDCADGLGAAWAVHCALGDNVEFVAAKYGESANDPEACFAKLGPFELKDRDVLFVDFSASLIALRAMAAEARSILVLDHHKTAREDLVGLYEPISWQDWQVKPVALSSGLPNPSNLAAIFDMDRSGAGIAWDYLHPSQPRPHIIDLIEDRDLWRFRFGGESRAFHVILASYDWTDLPTIFKWLDQWFNWEINAGITPPYETRLVQWERLIEEGHAILRAERILVKRTVAASRRTMRIAGYIVPVANVPAPLASEAGQKLCETVWYKSTEAAFDEMATPVEFSATYYDAADGKRHFSLRSPEGGADVGKIAKQTAERFNRLAKAKPEYEPGMRGLNLKPFQGIVWAGGGTKHAAGFDAPLNWNGE